MQGVKTAWRNSACLMLLSGPFKYRKPRGDELKGLPNFLEMSEHEGEKLELLFVQRHVKAGFMANTHVFPGGILDEADFSPKWLSLFGEMQRHHSNRNPLASMFDFRDSSVSRLPLYSTIPNDLDLVRGEIAFRICAIREMFEEAGVLVARDKNDVEMVFDMLPGSFKPAVKVLPDALLDHWRKRVHGDAREFLTMCRELECVPDIWSLIEWSNWLTPRNSRRRYDTVFYMCFVESKPPASADGAEVISSTWMSPEKASQLFMSQEIFLAPPQFAELKTLERFSDVPCLHSYSLSEMICGGSSYRRNSARMTTKDQVLVVKKYLFFDVNDNLIVLTHIDMLLLVQSVRECDDLYPIEGSEDWTTEIQHPKSISLREKVPLLLSKNSAFEYLIPSHTAHELATLSQNLCRMEFHPSFEFKFFDSQLMNKIDNYHRRFTQQVLKEKKASKL